MFTLHAGSHKHFGRRGPTHGVKDVDGSSIVSEGKHSRRGTGYNSHEVI
jgi:regulator of nonsense transcripts 3